MHEFFLDIKGQENALNILTEIHSSKRIPNALLFSGIDGIGKYYAAIQFLKLINSDKSVNNLNNIEKLIEPYVKMIFPLPRGKSETNSDLPTAKLSQDTVTEIQTELKNKASNPYHQISIKGANNIKINSIREINKIISLNFDEIPFRGIIISEAHKMTVEAQNAFLKNLEEPPEGIIYIILTSEPDALLTTIKSRCWNVKFNPLDDNSLNEILSNIFTINSKDINEILPFAQGSVSKALFLIENDFENYLQKTILILRYSLARKYHTAHKEFINVIDNNSIDSFRIVLDLIITWFADTLKDKYKQNNIHFKLYRETLEKFNIRFTKANISQVICKLVEYREAPDKNVNLNILLSNVIFEIASIGIKG